MSNTKFKKGDIVVCVREDGEYIHYGKEYEVNNDTLTENVKVKGCPVLYVNNRFLLKKSTEQTEYEKQSFVFDQVTINAPKHYDNTNGSLYKFAQDHGLNAWEFDMIKRIVRCRKKGAFKEDLEKTKNVIDIYLKEFSE